MVRTGAQNDSIRPVEIFDRAAIGNKNRLRNYDHLQASLLQSSFEARSGADRDRRRDHQNASRLGLARHPQPNLFDMTGGIGGKENNLRAPRKGLYVGAV